MGRGAAGHGEKGAPGVRLAAAQGARPGAPGDEATWISAAARPEELDLSRFELLRDSGKPEQALEQWRGEPLADFADQRFAEPEIARLEELRLACVEQRIELDLADGRHTELIGELEALVRLHPLREHLRAQLMLALYRSGRQAEALEAYQAARAALVDGLGIEPGPALRGLHQQILTQDPELDLAAPQQPPRTGPQVAPARADRRRRRPRRGRR